MLIGSAGFGQKIHAACRLATITWLAEIATTHPNRLLVEHAFKHVVYDSAVITPELVDSMYAIFQLSGVRRSFRRIIKSSLTLRGLKQEHLARIEEALPSLTMPTLLIWGKQDNVVPAHHSSFALERMPNAHLELFDGCRHFPMLEHPDKFKQLVLDFLQTHSESASPKLQVTASVA